MSQTEASTQPSGSSRIRELLHRLSAFRAMLVVSGLVLAPMVWTHLQNLSRVPHRSHFPLVIGSFLLMVVLRCRGAQGSMRRDMRVVDGLLLGLSITAFFGATSLDSPWLATFSAILLAGALLRRLPSRNDEGYLGPWSLLLLLLPLPFDLDSDLVQGLQALVTHAASGILDLAGIKHLMSGNVLELPGHELFVDEACSGIQSLFAMITCVALFAVWTRRPPIIAVPMLLASVVMCTISNIVRITIVAWARTRGLDLATGLPHEILGICLFCVSLGLVYCSEGFVLFLLAPVMNPATGAPDPRSARLWASLGPRVQRLLTGTEVRHDNPPELAPRASAVRTALARLIPENGARAGIAFATVCFAGLGLTYHAGLAGTIRRAENSRERAMLERSIDVDRSLLPAEIGEWKLTDFERVKGRDGRGTTSCTWTYASPYYQAVFSFDFPYYGPHNVSRCYHTHGWTVSNRETLPKGFARATLERPYGEFALLFYDVFGADGSVEVEGTLMRFGKRFRTYYGDGDRPTWQIQMLVRSDYGLTQGDIADIESGFVELREKVHARVQGAPAIARQPQSRGEGGTRG